MDGIDNADMMALLDNPFLVPGLDPFTMPLDQEAPPAMPPPLSAPLAPPMSQAVAPPMQPAAPSAPLVAPQLDAPPIPREQPIDDIGGQPNPVQPSTSGGTGSASTDFTKRRNWPEKVVEEMRDLLHVLDDHGKIKYVSRSVTALTGYQPGEIVNVHLKDLIHPDDVGLFVSEMNEAIASGESMRMFYRFKKKDGAFSIFEAAGRAHIAPPHFAPNPTNRSPFCQAVFLTSRPYPTKNARLLDSFLEHKVENERLRRRIASLRLEEEAEEADVERQLKQRRESRSELSQSEDRRTGGSVSAATGTSALSFSASSTVDGCMPPPDRPPSKSSGALTRENLEGAAAGSRPDSLRDKMARYERSSPVETIEMLTGRRYTDGERRGTGSGRTSPKLITGDAGITIPVGREARSGEKKRKQKVVEEYVCTDCGSSTFPMTSPFFLPKPSFSPIALYVMMIIDSQDADIPVQGHSNRPSGGRVLADRRRCAMRAAFAGRRKKRSGRC